MRKKPDAPETDRLDIEARLAEAEIQLTSQVFRVIAHDPETPESQKALALLKTFEATYVEMLRIRDNLRMSTYLAGRSSELQKMAKSHPII